MKRIVSFLLSVILVFSLFPAALAAGDEFQSSADHLYGLGLISGTGSDANGNPIYELDRAPTRSEAITVLVKLLGKADEAGKGGWNIPFTDVPNWAKNFVGYAYANGLTAGTSATTFGGDDLVTAAQYITFVLKALGYSANGDFQWDKAWELSDKLGITDGRYHAGTNTFLRGDVFLISEAALKIKVKDSEQTLAEKLMSAGAFTQAQYNSVYASAPSTPGESLTPRQISERCAPAVFYLETYTVNGAIMGSGSGFFVSADGLAITNRHVVENAYYLKVRTMDGRTFEDVRVLDGDSENDLALLWVVGENFPYLEQGDSDTLRQGQQVYAFGCPKGLENTMSQGIVSNPGRTVDDTRYVQISVPIDHGSSGGALVDEWGRVVGVTSGGFESTADLNLAVPINAAKELEPDRDTDLFLMAEDPYYTGFEYVLDFGMIAGIKQLEQLEMPLGWVMVYDLDDFYGIHGGDAATSYSNAMGLYFNALEDSGLQEYEGEAEGYIFANEEELVYILPDYRERVLCIGAEWLPVDYEKFPGVLDFGWMLGIDPKFTSVEDDGSFTYIYHWNEYFTAQRIEELVGLYAKHLVEQQGFKLVDEGYVDVDYVDADYAWLLSNTNYSVLIMVGDSGVLYVNIE